MGHPAIDIDTLSPEERLDLLEKLWDSLEPSQIPVTEAQKRELDRRLDALDRDVAERRGAWRSLG
jgi:putative addiction module component (TIGR02574 family)